MLLGGQEKIQISWNPKTRNYYENKGYIFTKYNDKFYVNFNDVYPTSTVKIKVKCDYCNKEYEVTYASYMRTMSKSNKLSCINCIGKKLSEQSLVQRQHIMYEKIYNICCNKNYKLLTKENELINNNTKIYYICKLHGKTYTKVTGLLQGNGCYKCGRIKAVNNVIKSTLHKRQDNLYSKMLKKADEKGYTIITPKENITNNSNYIKYKCPIHNEQQMKVANFISGKGCPKCAIDKNKKLYKLSFDEVYDRIYNLGGLLLNKYDYVNLSTKNLKILCPNCNKEFITSLRNFTQHNGQVCKECSNKESLGEIQIRKYLEKNNILYEQEKWFDDCRDINPLPFDFYLFEYNIIIEFDGKQHFNDRGYKSGKFSDSLEYTQLHDKIKTEYCKKNNIKLIRIPYWDFNNIETILNKELNLHKDIV